DMTLAQQTMLVNTFVVRATVDPAHLTTAARAAVSALDPTQVIVNVRTVEEYADAQLNTMRAYTTVLSVFGVASILLAMVGLYGILSYLVSQRRRETGIRMALGASRAAVVGRVVGQGMLMIAIGLGLGVGAALGVTRVLRTLLWGVTPTDPATF